MYELIVSVQGYESINPTTFATVASARKVAREVAREDRALYRGTGYVYRLEIGDPLDSSVIEKRMFVHPVFGADEIITIRKRG